MEVGTSGVEVELLRRGAMAARRGSRRMQEVCY
jgi:hypothetical protein